MCPTRMTTVDPARDLEAMEGEMILNDMTIIERRLERLAATKHRGTPEDRKKLEYEDGVMRQLMGLLEEETPLRDVDLSDDDRKMLAGFGFLSMKPILRVINAGDDDDESDLRRSAGRAHVGAARSSGGRDRTDGS